MIIDQWVDPVETMKFTQRAEEETFTDAAQSAGLILNDDVRCEHPFSVYSAWLC